MSRGSGSAEDADDALSGSQRLDKWLWFARVGKTRTLCATLVTEGKVRINGSKADKPAQAVKAGDVVTIIMRQRMRTLKVAGFAERRGGADIAAGLYEDLTPPPVKAKDAETHAGAPSVAEREPGSGRPTKRERREMDRFRFRST